MERHINPSILNGRAYIMTKRGVIEDIGCDFPSLTGYSKSDIYDKNVSEVLHMLFKSDLDPEKDQIFENYLFSKTGKVIEVSVSVYRAENDCRLYFFKTKHNLMLSSELSLVDKLIEDNHLGVGLYGCPDCRLLKANQKYIEFVKDAYRTEGNPVSLCLHEFAPGFNESEMQCLWEDAHKTGETAHVKGRMVVTDNGEIRYWNQSIIPISDGPEVRFIISLMEDATEATLTGKQIEAKNEELKKAIEMKDEMLLLITHELKTPLSIISSSVQAVELMCKNELTEKVRKYLNKIRQNAYRELKLINNILDNTKANSGLFKIEKTRVDIIPLTKSIVETITVFAERKGIKISFFSEMERPIVNIDVDVYERILLNLLSNAVKFTPEGKEIDVTVFSLMIKGMPQVCIQVRDNGIGIPSDQKDRIFERFGRGSSFVARHSEGTGIGLYLVKTLVSLLGGEIKVDSEEGEGSTFTLLFPQAKPNDAFAEAAVCEISGEYLLNATNIEFSDIYFGT